MKVITTEKIPDKIDEILNEFSVADGRVYHHEDREAFSVKLLALKEDWETEAFKRGYIQAGIDQINKKES